MCFYYDSESAAYKEKVRQARKDHKCQGCDNLIKSGDLYIYGSGIFDNSPFDVKICAQCKLTQLKIYEKELEDGCHPQESWCTLVEVGDYCRCEGFKMSEYEESQQYLLDVKNGVKT